MGSNEAPWRLVGVNDGLADGYRQRQHILAAALGAAQRDRAGAPVDVVQAELGDVATAKSQIKGAAHEIGRAHV